MHINKISVNNNFGVKLTAEAINTLKKYGATEFEISCFPCLSPTDATIDVEKGKPAYIYGKHATITLPPTSKLTVQTARKLCEAYNIKKYFDIENTKPRNYF